MQPLQTSQSGHKLSGYTLGLLLKQETYMRDMPSFESFPSISQFKMYKPERAFGPAAMMLVKMPMAHIQMSEFNTQLQPPAQVHPGRQQVKVLVIKSLPYIWETRTELQTPGFILAQYRPLQAFGKRTSKWKISLGL